MRRVVLAAGLPAVALGLYACTARAHTALGHLQGGSNRLIHQTSPYLLEHAHNPVDWYPWGLEAFAAAKRLNRPVFVSIGYSACHWCHVMEHESFEDRETAALLNSSFVCIKVDREERPDVDNLYLTAVQAITGRGGWPLSAFLTPAGNAFYGGTYYPPDEFRSLISRVAAAWKDHRAAVEQDATNVAAVVVRQLRTLATAEPSSLLVEQAVQNIKAEYDTVNAGYGAAPKFPPYTSLLLLEQRCLIGNDPEALKQITGTLNAMARGGIYDQLGGGFHRYSTDATWTIPHFEKMLYDNALLAQTYTKGYELTNNSAFSRTAVGTLDWALQTMRGPEGGFYSSVDADSAGHEGVYYLWNPAQVALVLGSNPGSQFCSAYGISGVGDYLEPPAGTPTGLSVPHLSSRTVNQAQFAVDRAKLLTVRNGRAHPNVDIKRITGWNGLMISALSRAGNILHRQEYLLAAQICADFLMGTMRPNRHLLHTYTPPATNSAASAIPADLGDYAYAVNGLLDLAAATHEANRVAQAVSLAGEMQILAASDGGYYDTLAWDPLMPVRSRNPFDSPLPSPNGSAVHVMLRLYKLTGDRRWLVRSRNTLASLDGSVRSNPTSTQTLALATAEYLGAAGKVQAVVAPSTVATNALSAALTMRSSAQGTAIRGTLTLAVHRGWHINSDKPDDKSLIATRLTVLPPQGFRVVTIQYPQAVPVLRTGLRGYVGSAIISFNLMSTHARHTAVRVSVRLTYQPCTTTACQAPTTITLSALAK